MGNKNESFIILLLRIWNKDPAFQKQAHFATTLSNAKVLNGKKKFSIFPGTSITFFRLFDITQIFLHNILRVTLVSTALVKLLLLAKHLSLLSVWTLLRRLIVRSFFTTPSNVC